MRFTLYSAVYYAHRTPRHACQFDKNTAQTTVKLGYRECIAPPVEDIFAACDEELFSKISRNSLHILQQFLPERPSLSYSLRPRPHNKTLITKSSQLNDRNFIIRSIYKDS